MFCNNLPHRIGSRRFPILKATRFASTNNNASKHHDLRSFLNFIQSQHTRIATDSTYYKGLLYEYTVQHALQKLIGIQPLSRCGGTGDNGIDLMGIWDLEHKRKKTSTATSDSSLTVLVQCKASMAKTGARLFREMEGVHSYHVSKSKEEGKTLLIVAAPSAITKQGFAQFQTTDIPIIYCQIDRVRPIFDAKQDKFRLDIFEHHSIVQGLLANQAAQQLLKQYEMTTAKINVIMKSNETKQQEEEKTDASPRSVVEKITLA